MRAILYNHYKINHSLKEIEELPNITRINQFLLEYK